MLPVRYGLLFIVLALASSCTSITVKPVDRALDIKHVCVKDCSEKCFDGRMLGIIQDGLQRHGISTQVYNGDLKSECEYNLTYYCERTWDMATYLHHAELRLYNGKSQIGNAEYHLRGKGGFALNKWASTKSKIDPVIDELFSDFQAAK
jgi:hypothetical protein